jgi:hypothetical protein
MVSRLNQKSGAVHPEAMASAVPETWHITHVAETSVQLFPHRRQQGSKRITG